MPLVGDAVPRTNGDHVDATSIQGPAEELPVVIDIGRQRLATIVWRGRVADVGSISVGGAYTWKESAVETAELCQSVFIRIRVAEGEEDSVSVVSHSVLPPQLKISLIAFGFTSLSLQFCPPRSCFDSPPDWARGQGACDRSVSVPV